MMHREGKIQGIGLPVSILNNIYRGNFLRIVGENPHPLNIMRARKYCHEMGQILKVKFSFSDEANFAYQAENLLSAI